MIDKDLQKKIDQSIKLLKVACKGKKVELCYSGGKDSDVILQLAKEAEIDFVPIYKMTTIDPPGTIKHARENGCEIRRPEKTFFQLVREAGLPSRFRRFCCAYLKEYKIMDNAIAGVRRAESTKRAKRYKEPTQCRIYGKGEHVNQIFPILEWTNDDVKNYILDRGIKCHPLYYDEKGNFRVERRLGCIGCPLKSKARDDFKKYPKFVKAYIDAVRVFIDGKSERRERYKDPYIMFYAKYFCSTAKDYHNFMYQLNGNNLFADKIDVKKFLEDYYGIELGNPKPTKEKDKEIFI